MRFRVSSLEVSSSGSRSPDRSSISPEILLADEPTGNLDPELSEDILRVFLDIHLRGTTVIFATHDRELINRVGKRVLTLEKGQLLSDRDPEREILAAPVPEAPVYEGMS